jgi:CheY-like chemotaxis protein
MIRVLYVDDEADARLHLKRLLDCPDIDVTAIPPPAGLALPKGIGDFDCFLVDYELTRPEEDGSKVSYRGGALGFSILEAAQDRPVILVTREGLVKKRELELLDELPVFDAVIYKGEVERQPEAGQRLIARLSGGFADLRGARRSWAGLLAVLGGTEDQNEAALRASSPPLAGTEWSVSGTARWLERVIFRYPGPMYDRLHTAVALGLDPAAMADPDLASLIGPARYQGALAPHDGRWWRASLIRLATRFSLDAECSGPIRTAFASAFEKQYGRRLEPARCVHCDEPGADCVCYILHSPVKAEHSLAYSPDWRPVAMEGARVSFKAVVERNEVRREYLDASSESLVRSLRAAAQNEAD